MEEYKKFDDSLNVLPYAFWKGCSKYTTCAAVCEYSSQFL